MSNKPEKGHADKAKTSPKRFIRELRGVELSDYEVAQKLPWRRSRKVTLSTLLVLQEVMATKVTSSATTNHVVLKLTVPVTTEFRVQWFNHQPHAKGQEVARSHGCEDCYY